MSKENTNLLLKAHMRCDKHKEIIKAVYVWIKCEDKLKIWRALHISNAMQALHDYPAMLHF